MNKQLRKLVTLTGPTCSGKTTLLSSMIKNQGFNNVVSHTTREPRVGELDGTDYYFISKKDFQLKYDQKDFIETVPFRGNMYGVCTSQIKNAWLNKGIPVLIVEPTGLHQICQYCYDNEIQHTSVYIGGELNILMDRYLNRSSDVDFSESVTREVHARRLSGMHAELDWEWDFPYDINFISSNEEVLENQIETIKRRINNG